MGDAMTEDEFTKLVFEAGQQPAAWLRSAGHLRDAAEVILRHELQAEVSYSLARKIAEGEAAAARVRDGANFAVADIKATAPNYPPAQVLYAYAIEDVLKGLIVFNQPELIQEHKLDDELKNHDLNELAEKAEVTVGHEERPILEALSQLSIWAGRYPVAVNRRDMGTPNPNALLRYGSPIQSCGRSSSAPIKSLRAGWSHSQPLKK